MAPLAETRDNDTGNHIRRTQFYLELLGVPSLRLAARTDKRISHSTARAEVSRPGTGFKPRGNTGLAARVAGSP